MLKDKAAVVTGSTSGIGLGIARAFAREGANVMLNGLGDPAEIEKVRAAIEADFGVRALFSPANLLHAEEVTKLVADETAKWAQVIRVAGIKAE